MERALKVEPRIRVLCVDDHVVVLRGLAAILAQEPDIDVIACATTAQEGVDKYLQLRPDVTLMDLQMPGMNGFSAIRAIREKDPLARILVLTMLHGSEDVRRALEAGAVGYLFKDTLADSLVHTIREVHAGQQALGDAASTSLAGEPVLTTREVEVMQMVANGMRNKEIGVRLGISEETVHTHLRSIFAKLNVHDRTLALAVAVRRGFVHLI
jgi:DNA-binding NarL/FixJ family response regulator